MDCTQTLTGRLDLSCHWSLRCFGRESVDGATQAITTLINSRVCSGVEGKVLQRWASGEATGVVTPAVVATNLHAGGPGHWSLVAGSGDSSNFRQHLGRLSSPI
jgi:hypothetical protein